jgi:hypothetical protein
MGEFPFGEVVLFEAQVVGAEDAHGNPVESFAAPVSVPGWGFDPGGSVERFDPGRDPVITNPRLFRKSNDFVPGARDRCTVRGLLFVVDGDPAVWQSPFTGWQPGVVVGLERVSG